MSIAYLDTSALVKRYVMEPGSEWVKALLGLENTPTAFTSRLTVVEAACALARRRREGGLSPMQHTRILTAFDYDVKNQYNILDVEPVVIDKARELADLHPLRAYDAVHLASAWLANQKLVLAGHTPLTFVCADDVLIGIAQAVGLGTENPNHHP